MHMFSPPSGYLSLHEARNELRHAMHQGVPCSKEVEKLRSEGLDVCDHSQTLATVKILREAIFSGDLSAHADLSLSGQPRQLSPELCQIALKPKDGTVLTFAYLARHQMADLIGSRSDVKQLMRATLLVPKQEFEDFLQEREQKKVWPCH